MTIKEALELLQENNYIIESADFNDYEADIAKYAKLRDANRTAMTKAKTTYKDDKRYNDHYGKKWLNVSARDKKTLLMAIVDGMCDAGYYDMTTSDYKKIKTEADIQKLLEDEGDAKSIAAKIIKFLTEQYEKVKKDGGIRVYRGITISHENFKKLYAKDKYVLTSPERLVKYFSNETKEFNSFTVNPKISKSFSRCYQEDRYYIIITGIADMNDINWAFTAYLMGRHGGTGECELNLNNIKSIKDLKIDLENSKIPTRAHFNAAKKCSVNIAGKKYSAIKVNNRIWTTEPINIKPENKEDSYYATMRGVRYYTLDGVKSLDLEGWRLPTANEVDVDLAGKSKFFKKTGYIGEMNKGFIGKKPFYASESSAVFWISDVEHSTNNNKEITYNKIAFVDVKSDSTDIGYGGNTDEPDYYPIFLVHDL